MKKQVSSDIVISWIEKEPGIRRIYYFLFIMLIIFTGCTVAAGIIHFLGYINTLWLMFAIVSLILWIFWVLAFQIFYLIVSLLIKKEGRIKELFTTIGEDK